MNTKLITSNLDKVSINTERQQIENKVRRLYKIDNYLEQHPGGEDFTRGKQELAEIQKWLVDKGLMDTNGEFEYPTKYEWWDEFITKLFG